MDKELTADEIIDALGGTSETARLCEVEPPSVSDWRKYGIPHARLMFIKLARPDIFRPTTDHPPRHPIDPSKIMTAAVDQPVLHSRANQLNRKE